MSDTAPTTGDGSIDEVTRVRRLDPPTGEVEIVLDTDTANEIDDQFALAYALCSETIDVKAVYAAPFHNTNSTGPADGMAKSDAEIIHVLELLEHPHRLTFQGARGYLDDRPIEAPATDDLIRRARNRDGDTPLYVVAIGAPTNVATAITGARDHRQYRHCLAWRSSPFMAYGR